MEVSCLLIASVLFQVDEFLNRNDAYDMIKAT